MAPERFKVLQNPFQPVMVCTVSPCNPTTISNSYVVALTQNVTIFGDRDFREVIKIKWGHKGGALIQ